MPYDASIGGHAPGHIRGAFWDWVYAGFPATFRDEDGVDRTATWVIGQLWNCSDILPSSGYAEMPNDLPAGDTYGSAARALKKHLAAV